MPTVAIAGQTFTFPIGLFSQADTKLLKTNPTIGAADFRKSISGGALLALDNTPTVTPAGGVQVEIVLSAAETTAAGAGGRIAIWWQDAVGAEWCSSDALVFVHAAEVATVGDAMALTVGERTAVSTVIWTVSTPRTLTVPAVTLPVSSGTDLVLYKYANNSIAITGLTLDPARTAMYLTIKASPDDEDAAALVQITETAGLTILNGAATTAAWGSITPIGLTGVTFALVDHAALQLDAGSYTWDLKQILAAGAAIPLTTGKVLVQRVVTRAVV